MLLLFLLFLTASAFHIKTDQKDIVLKVLQDRKDSPQTEQPTEWLESPWGSLYQFKVSSSNWLSAREQCLAINSDLVVVKNDEQLEWILGHYPSSFTRFSHKLVQIGLYLPEGDDKTWKWVDGSDFDAKNLSWVTGEPVDHSESGRERCGLLNVVTRNVDDVDCEENLSDKVAQRFICERSSEVHVKQQKSNNYIWTRIEQLFNYFGIGSSPETSTKNTTDYEDEVNDFYAKNQNLTKTNVPDPSSSEEETEVLSFLKTLPKPSVEGSGDLESSGESLEKVEGSGDRARAHATRLQELSEGSGESEIEEIPKAILQIDDPTQLDKMIEKMENMLKELDNLNVTKEDVEGIPQERTTLKVLETTTQQLETSTEKVHHQFSDGQDDNSVTEAIEDDFDTEKEKLMPKANITLPDDEDCDKDIKVDEEGIQKLNIPKDREEHVKEFLGVLRLFLERAEQGDLRKLLDDKSGKTLLERMKKAINEANKREFEMLEKVQELKNNGENCTSVEMKRNSIPETERAALYKKISNAVFTVAERESKKQDEKEPEITNEQLLEPGTVEVLKSSPESNATNAVDYADDFIPLDSKDGKVSEKKEEDTTVSTTTVTETTTVEETTTVAETTTETTTEATTIEVVPTKELVDDVTTAEPSSTTTEEPVESTTTEDNKTEARNEAGIIEVSTRVMESGEELTTPVFEVEKKVDPVKPSKNPLPELEGLDSESEKAPEPEKKPLPKAETKKPKAVSKNPLGFVAPTVAPFPKLPTFEEVLKNLSDQFKALLQPPTTPKPLFPL